MSPKVSIIVPIYNAEKYIKKCVDSILSQTLENIEIIFINDGSVDESKVILDEYKAKDSRVKVIHQENSGPAAARNNGIKIAKGKYIGFVDSDDYIESTMYEKLFSIADSNNVQMAMCNYKEVHLYDNREQFSNHKLVSDHVYRKNEIEEAIISTFSKSENYGFYSLCNKLYLRQWISDSNIIIDESRDHGEDWWFNIQLFMRVDSFICVDEHLYNYIHVNVNSLMGKYRENQFELCLDGRLKLISIIPERLIDYRELNTRFIYEISGYVLRTFQEIESKKRCNELISRVLKDNDVIESCKYSSELPIHFRVLTFFIKYKIYYISFYSYKFYSKFV